MKANCLIFFTLLAAHLCSCKPDDCPPDLVDNTSPIVWKRAFEKTDLSSTPLYFDGLIIVGHPSVNEVYKIYAYDAVTGDTVWQQSMNMFGNFGPNFEDELFLYENKVVFSESQDFGVLDANTGQLIWYKTKDDFFRGSCVIDDNVFKVETDEIVFTLLLALRFTSIVFEETRNLSLGLASRGLDWKNLGFRGSIDVFMQLLARLMDSLFANAKAISEAAESRGYNSNSDDDDDNDFFDNERGYGTQDNSKSYLRIENYVGTFLLCAFVLHFSDFHVAKMFSSA